MLLKDITTVHCLFEQSGHFKNVFKSLGLSSYDYDIENKFNETDFQLDLFDEIFKARNLVDKDNLFNTFKSDSLVIAFFPCTMFTENTQMIISCHQRQLINISNLEKCFVSSNHMNLVARFYNTLCDLVYISFKYGFKLIIENPYSYHNFLKHYFPFKADIIVMNRHLHGDYFEKPTQFWFFNFSPIINFVHYLPIIPSLKKIKHCNYGDLSRSLISEEFVKWFIQEYLFEDIDFNKGG